MEHRRLPHVDSFARRPILFLTVVSHLRRPCLANQHAFNILTQIWRNSPAIDGWFVGDYLLMPDHVHLFARAGEGAKPLARWLQTWKSLSSRQLTPQLQIEPPFWQRDYFDRFLRTTEDYAKKWDYVSLNPVRQKLCATAMDWPWKGQLHEMRF